MTAPRFNLEKDFYSEFELSEEMVDQLVEDPRYFRDEFGFHRCLTEKDLRKMSRDQLMHLRLSSDNPRNAASAENELNRRKTIWEHRLNIRDNIISGIIGGVIVVIVEYVFKTFFGWWLY